MTKIEDIEFQKYDKMLTLYDWNAEWLNNDAFLEFEHQHGWARRNEPGMVIVLCISDADGEIIDTLPEDLQEIINDALMQGASFLSLVCGLDRDELEEEICQK